MTSTPPSTHPVTRDPDALHDVRAWLVAELRARSGLSEERIDDASVMVNELTSNVLLHTHDTGEVHLEIAPDSVRIEVRDRGEGVPVVRPVDPTRLGGNGLRIVEAWSTEWGVSRRAGGGKTVWICLEV
jgi:anti-sigma regulatory factor (Ser/Thr protein kinase)